MLVSDGKCAEPPCIQVRHQTVKKLRKVLVGVGFKQPASPLAAGWATGSRPILCSHTSLRFLVAKGSRLGRTTTALDWPFDMQVRVLVVVGSRPPPRNPPFKTNRERATG